MSSFLSTAENAAQQLKMFDVIFKKLGEESTSVVGLALEGHIVQKHNFKPLLTKEQCQISKLLIVFLSLAAVMIFSKHKRRMRKQTIGSHFEFFNFILQGNILEEMR